MHTRTYKNMDNDDVMKFNMLRNEVFFFFECLDKRWLYIHINIFFENS